MTDREKVNKGVECHRKKVQTKSTVSCLECPYSEPKQIKEWCMHGLMDDIYALLKEQPEIVRCEDCAFRDPRDGMCEHVLQIRDPDWYCADGERRDDNG